MFLPARNVALFLLVGVAIGIVLGGTQALSRSFFSLLIPRGREGEYFALYNACRARHLVVRHAAVRRGLPGHRLLPAGDRRADRLLRARRVLPAPARPAARHPRRPGNAVRSSEPLVATRTEVRPERADVTPGAHWRESCGTGGTLRDDAGSVRVVSDLRRAGGAARTVDGTPRGLVRGLQTKSGGASWQSAHYVERGWEARASRTSAASSSPPVSRCGYRCPQGHEFEITMSVEADVPAVWECPRCGAEALSTSRHPARGEGREAGPHALGHAARAPLRSRSSRTSSRSASSCCAAARSAPRTCTAPTPGRRKA